MIVFVFLSKKTSSGSNLLFRCLISDFFEAHSISFAKKKANSTVKSVKITKNVIDF